MYNECNCGNSQSLEIRGPSRRHHPEETSETASPRFIPSILCSEFHREPQFPVPVELLILEMAEMPVATSWAPPASREAIPVPDTPDGLKRSWSFLYIVGCVRARPDTSNGNPWKAEAKIQWLHHKPHQQERFNAQKTEAKSIKSPKRKV